MRTATAIAVALATTVALTACGGSTPPHTVTTASLSPGTYRAVAGAGWAPADEARMLAITALLDRAQGRLVLTLADGSQRTLAFSPRPREQWEPDCFTMSSHVLEEVADLSPAPLRLESLELLTPVAFAKCGPGRMILADAPAGEPSASLVLDLQ